MTGVASELELLRFRDRKHDRLRKPREFKEIIPDESLWIADDGVAKSQVDVEFRIRLAEHDGLARELPASCGGIGEFRLKFTDAERDIIPKIDIGRGLQQVPEIGRDAGWRDQHREI